MKYTFMAFIYGTIELDEYDIRWSISRQVVRYHHTMFALIYGMSL